MKRATYAAMSVAVLFTVQSCSDSSRGSASADCSDLLRYEGTVYKVATVQAADLAATQVGQADASDCHDTGRHPEGAVFPPNPRQVDVWSVKGFDTEAVLATRTDDGSYTIFVPENAADTTIKKLRRALAD